MKTPLFVLLALSLAANAVLALFVWQRPGSAGNVAVPPAATAGSALREKSAGAAVSASPAQSGEATGSFQWPAVQRKEDLPALVAGLRAAGFPPATIRAVVSQIVGTLFAERSNSYIGPYWKAFSSSPDQVAGQQALAKERRELLESLLGPDGRPSATMEPAWRERRYGQLSNEKIDAIEAINRDYGTLQSQAHSQVDRTKPQDGAALAKQMDFIREEQRKDIAALLTPEELEQYDMRTSPTAQRVMGNLRNVDVTEAEYAALYRLQQEFDRNNPTAWGRPGTETAVQREAAQARLQEGARSVLTDDRYYEYLKTADHRYAQAATFAAQYPSVTPATTFQLYQLDVSTQAAISQLPRTLTPDQRKAEMQNLGAAYNAKVQSLLGSQLAEAYGNQGTGRAFRSGSGNQSAVRLGGG